jgi:hypothetical protein
MAYESELEALPEFEDEFEAELEGEMEGESEDETEYEAGLEGEGWLGALGNIAGSLLGEQEMEGEDEFESEDESEISPIRKIYPDAMMEHLGELAAESESEDEAVEHFLPLIGMAASKLLPVVARAIAPMAKRALPKIARALTKSTPHLTKGVSRVAKALHRNPQTRHLLRAVPSIARRTVGNIARQVAHGRHITPRTAVRTLAKQTRYVLGSPRQRQHALRRHKHLERRFHGRMGRGVAPPHHRRIRQSTSRSGTPGVVAGTPARGVTYSAGTPSPAGRPGVGGGTVSGQCNCAPCPACGGSTATQSTPSAAAAPQYCRCCGQVIR